MRRLIRLVVAAHLVIVTMVVASPVGAADAYTITDLGTLGGEGSLAAAVNEAGNVAGTSNTSAGEPNAFRWKGGLLVGIHSLGGYGSEGTDINDDGWVVGSGGRTDGYVEAFYWAGTDPHPIGTLGGRTSQAFAINNDEVIVGRSPNADGIFEAFRWQGGSMVGLGGLVAGGSSEAWEINDAGVIVGDARAADGFVHAFRHAGGAMEDLGTPSPNFAASWARGINDAGVIVGGTQVANGGAEHPFVLTDGSWDVLTDIVGYADAVNTSGQVVGTSSTPAGETAFLYEDGVLTDLNQLVPAGSGWQLGAATDINDAGQIVGQGWFDGEGRAFLLTPVTVTADLAVVGAASRDKAKAGQVVTQSWLVTNQGPGSASAVVFEEALPSGVEVISIDAPGCDVSTGLIRCQMGTLSSGSSLTVSVELRVTAGGGTELTSTGSASSSAHDLVPGNNTAVIVLRTVGARGR